MIQLIAAKAFGSYPGHARWSTIADINGDFKIDIRDIASIAKKFGWACMYACINRGATDRSETYLNLLFFLCTNMKVLEEFDGFSRRNSLFQPFQAL